MTYGSKRRVGSSLWLLAFIGIGVLVAFGLTGPSYSQDQQKDNGIPKSLEVAWNHLQNLLFGKRSKMQLQPSDVANNKEVAELLYGKGWVEQNFKEECIRPEADLIEVVDKKYKEYLFTKKTGSTQ